jgi:hypothetical protein
MNPEVMTAYGWGIGLGFSLGLALGYVLGEVNGRVKGMGMAIRELTKHSDTK